MIAVVRSLNITHVGYYMLEIHQVLKRLGILWFIAVIGIFGIHNANTI